MVTLDEYTATWQASAADSSPKVLDYAKIMDFVIEALIPFCGGIFKKVNVTETWKDSRWRTFATVLGLSCQHAI